MEVLAANIRANPAIASLGLPRSVAPLLVLSLYADDTTIISTSNAATVAVFDTYAPFEEGTGSKLNLDKCEGLWLGAWRNWLDALVPIAQSAILQKIRNLRLNAKRQAAKQIAEARFFKRWRGRNVSKILKEYPDISKTIENYVRSAGVGADSWRRTGVLAFDGNRKVQKKPMFSKIKEHLEMVYGKKFGYVTIVELCVARNKRRKTSLCYRGLARVTCRRAIKGFTI